ncbi:XRE family transcriptional regulator [Sphaerisporangium flaviroseum]|uniref:XRE family transcriptional regulator n=1 Tax=Sphaerisporangium flaviroseum TaxID=509199 RepID=A0ABP7IGP2_9ACTN
MTKPDNSALAQIFDSPGEMAEIERRASRRIAGLRLGEIRKRLGLTQQVVAERMGVSQKRVSAIENGTLSVVQVSTLAAYAEALGGELDVAINVGDQHLEIA